MPIDEDAEGPLWSAASGMIVAWATNCGRIMLMQEAKNLSNTASKAIKP